MKDGTDIAESILASENEAEINRNMDLVNKGVLGESDIPQTQLMDESHVYLEMSES